MHDLCKGFGALMSRSKLPGFAEEASRRNDRGNLPLHAACSFQPTTEVIEMLIRSYPEGPRVANNIGNLPLHQAAMWQASVEVLDILLEAFPEGSAVRNQYGSLPLHMASSNQAKMETIRRLMEVYPEAVHLQNDDGMTPLDLVLADESPNEAVVAMLEGRPPPPELSKRDQSEKYKDRADAMERKLAVFRDSSGQQRGDLDLALLAIRKLADTIPHSLYAAGMDPNELEIALSEVPGGLKDAEDIILQLVKKSVAEKQNGSNGKDSSKLEGSEAPIPGAASSGPVRDRVEDLLDTIVGLSHLKSQIRGLRRSMEISDLHDSLSAKPGNPPTAANMLFVGNPGTGKTTVGRLVAKLYHELGFLRKPKFLEVERLDMVGRTREQTIMKTREVIDEARGGILFIDEAYTLSMSGIRGRGADCGEDAIQEMIKEMTRKSTDMPLIILAGFPEEIHQFVGEQPLFKKHFPLLFQFPDYSCKELSRIFLDMAFAKGFDVSSDLTEEAIGSLLEAETTAAWRRERNGRVSEMLLSGVRAQVRMRMRTAAFEEREVDSQLIIWEDVENVVVTDFK